MPTVKINPRRIGQLHLDTVKDLHRALGGNPKTESMIMRFIEDRYKVRNFFHLTPYVASQMLQRPKDVIAAAKAHCLGPELL